MDVPIYFIGIKSQGRPNLVVPSTKTVPILVILSQPYTNKALLPGAPILGASLLEFCKNNFRFRFSSPKTLRYQVSSKSEDFEYGQTYTHTHIVNGELYIVYDYYIV